MENTNITNIVLGKKIDSYDYDEKNFIAPHEITVTITIREYRKLIEEVATKKADIDKANCNKYEREQLIKDLQDEVLKLKSDLYELQKGKDNEN